MRTMSSQTKADLDILRIYDAINNILCLLQSVHLLYFKSKITIPLLGIPHFMGSQFVQGIKQTQAGANEPM